MARHRGRSLAAGDQTSEDAQVNLTPLIDVVFVVLIMFILIAPILELDRVTLAPAANHSQKTLPVASEGSSLSIHVHADNSIWIQSKAVTEEQLIQFLKQARKQHPRSSPQLYHDKRAAFGTYQIIKNAAELAGYEEIDVILQPG